MKNKYEPSSYIKNAAAGGSLDPMKGLTDLIKEARTNGWEISVDLGDDSDPETMWEEVTEDNVIMACHEMDMTNISFDKEGQPSVGMLVIPHNGGPDEWLCDYHAAQWMEELVHKHIITE